MPTKSIPSIELPDDLESKYVNFARISHTASEFILDYSLLLPGVKKPEVNARLVMSPIAAKLFLRAMRQSSVKSTFLENTLWRMISSGRPITRRISNGRKS